MAHLTKQIDTYLDHLAREKRYSARTVGAYRDDLRLFADFMARRVQPDPQVPDEGGQTHDKLADLNQGVFALDQVALEDLRGFVAYLERERGNGASTQARRIAALRSLFNFAEIEGWIAGNPARRLATPKLPQRRPVHLTASDSRELLGKIEAGHRKDKVRNLAIVTLFLHAGLRLSELLRLDLADVDLDEGLVRVIGKGDKERVVPLTQEAQRALQAYLAVRPEAEAPALFLSHRKQRLSKNALQHMVKARSGNPGLSPHKLRHSCATMLHGADVSLVELQRLLGHASVSTTQIYTHTNLKRLRAAVRRHPLADGEPG